jgi:hypothetical protein
MVVGHLTPVQLEAYIAYSGERFGTAAQAQMAPAYERARAAATSAGGRLDMETFIDLVRDQVR